MESSPATTHSRDVILRAFLKYPTWVIAGGKAGEGRVRYHGQREGGIKERIGPGKWRCTYF